MNKQNDHDLLIEINTVVKYIKDKIDCHAKQIEFLSKENEARKDWEVNADTKIKLFAGIATFVGGIIVFVADRIMSWFVVKK